MRVLSASSGGMIYSVQGINRAVLYAEVFRGEVTGMNERSGDLIHVAAQSRYE